MVWDGCERADFRAISGTEITFHRLCSRGFRTLSSILGRRWITVIHPETITISSLPSICLSAIPLEIMVSSSLISTNHYTSQVGYRLQADDFTVTSLGLLCPNDKTRPEEDIIWHFVVFWKVSICPIQNIQNIVNPVCVKSISRQTIWTITILAFTRQYEWVKWKQF